MYNEAKMRELFTEETLGRIKVSAKRKGANLDVHYLPEYKAAILVNSLLIFAGDLNYVRVIHGYNHGKAIQQRVRKQFADYPMVERMVMPHNNPGETVFYLKKAA